MLKILFAVDGRFPGVGGAEIQSLKLANALRKKGVEVEFVAPYLDRSFPLDDRIEGFRLTKIDYPQIKLLGSIVLTFKFAHYLYRHQQEYDCVHVHITRILAAAAGMVRPFINCVVVTKISGYFEFEGGILDQNRRFNPANMLIRFALRKIDYVQTISVQTREKLETAGFRSEQIQFIPNGIEVNSPGRVEQNPVTSNPAKPILGTRNANGCFVLGYCGRMRAIKGVHILIEGFARLVELNSDVELRLRIAGDGETERELVKLAGDLNVTDRIDFLGYIDDTGSFLNSLNLYIQPSFAEGLPNAVIEAMNFGLPVVATDIGGNNDLIAHEETGRLFEAGDVAGLVTQLQWCLDNRNQLSALGERGRSLIESSYGFDQVTEKLIALYQRAPV